MVGANERNADIQNLYGQVNERVAEVNSYFAGGTTPTEGALHGRADGALGIVVGFALLLSGIGFIILALQVAVSAVAY
jgi:hypothetical protein